MSRARFYRISLHAEPEPVETEERPMPSDDGVRQFLEEARTEVVNRRAAELGQVFGIVRDGGPPMTNTRIPVRPRPMYRPNR